MSRPFKGHLGWAAALAAALPAFLFPLYNPDLFWHLLAGRWIWQHGSLPYAEFLSFSMPGRPWLDFEWLSQLLFYGLYSLGGFWALYALKVFLVQLCWLVFDAALRLNGLGRGARAAGLLAWALSALAWSDIRPELFSLLFFTVCLWRLEALRLDLIEPRWPQWLETAALFALWSNLHAGFPAALTLIAIYAVGEIIAGRPRRAARTAVAMVAGAAGALANPYGAGPYRVALEHFKVRADLALYIAEWHPMSPDNPLHWPFYGLLALAVLAAAARLAEPYRGPAHWRRPVAWAPLLACGHFASNALMHARMSAFFGIVAALFLAIVADEARGWPKRIMLAAAAGGLVFVVWLTPRLRWNAVFNDKFVPRRAAEFMARQEPALAPLRLFNQWEWGGYLAWRLRPWLRVFSDGRYVFHELLAEESRASESPETWREFMRRRQLDGALVPNRDSQMPMTRRYADGTEKTFMRPWYISYFPKDEWALVYWDDQALLFIARKDAPVKWIEAHEYRLLKPRDEAAFEDARARGEIPSPALQAERARHDDETAVPAPLR